MSKFNFIDLFAGIGGFRLGLEAIGGTCVFSSEIDEHACKMYEENFGINPYCDITTLDVGKIPNFDILCAGFPCQTFSISGKQKGFYDDTRGTLFFDICRILENKKPKAFILENVANLEKHDKGNTLSIMIESLSRLGYVVNYKVLNAKNFGVPQNRERIIIIGSKNNVFFDFNQIKENPIVSMNSFLDTNILQEDILNPNEYTIIDNYKRQPKSDLIFIGYRNKKIRTAGVRPNTEHLSRVHKQPNRIYSTDGVHPTIASQETSGRYWIYDGEKVRKLSINECYRFMGYPTTFKKIGLKSKQYERIGNSICVNMVKEIAKQVHIQIIMEEKNMNEISPNQFLEEVYQKALDNSVNPESNLTNEQVSHIKKIAEFEETCKGVYTVLFTSLTYKSLYSSQDVRYHQSNMDNGYSGRTFDTKYVTPFLKSKQLPGAMKESGWLTRSLEQNLPYNLDYPGKINNKAVKEGFLFLMDCIEKTNTDPKELLILLLKESLLNKSKKVVTLINPIQKESQLNIEQILKMLHDHFYFKYKSRGASILPVVAMYSIYQCLIKEISRFNDKKLESLASHTSCDRSSGTTGDIVIRNSDNSLYEVLEIKFDIKIDLITLSDAYKKFGATEIQRYYLLSTIGNETSQRGDFLNAINDIRNEHGCEVIIDNLFKTLEYYLRLLKNTDDFLNNYITNLESNTEINYEHKISWNKILQN